MDFRLAFYVPHHPIHKLREKTSKDDLFGLILLIYSIFHHFPKGVFGSFPRQNQPWAAQHGPLPPLLSEREEDTGAGDLFPSPNLPAKGNSKTGQKGKVCWLAEPEDLDKGRIT